MKFMQTTKKPLQKSFDLCNGFSFQPVAQNFIETAKVATTITFGAQEGTRTPTKLLAST
jgi:hypothetical protein